MNLTAAQILSILTFYKYYLLFPLVMFEGPIATIIGGFLAAQDLVNFFIAYIVIIAGDLAGDLLYYAAGRWGRQSLIERWGKYIGASPEKIAGLEEHFTSHSGKTLILGKLAHGIGSVILLAAGISRVPWGRFVMYNLAGTIPKSLVLMLIGYYFGSVYARLNKYVDVFALTTLSLAVLLVLIYWLIMKLSKKAEKKL